MLEDDIANHEQMTTSDLRTALLIHFTLPPVSDDEERYRCYERCKPALLRLHVEDPVGFQLVVKKIKECLGIATGAVTRDIDLLSAAQARAQQAHAAAAAGSDCPYAERLTGIVWRKPVPGGVVETTLCNFTARIVSDLAEDDGVEVKRSFEIEVHQGGRRATIKVPAERFAAMAWPVEALGARAILAPGPGAKDHTRAAIQHFSQQGVQERWVYAYVGWREINERWVYLHTNGAIGKDGTVDGIAVNPPDELKRFLLPDPPQGEDRVTAIRASLRLLTVAPKRLTVPLLAGTYTATLGNTTLSLHYAGQTGKGKTALAALAQQHYGAGMDAENLPASWGSTGNSLEVLAFAAKDALLVIDDFAPTGSTAEVQRYHREADRLLRAQANRSGRARLRSDATLRPVKPPRGLILSTGEDVPRGQSLRARLLVLEVNPGDVDLVLPTDTKPLTLCQKDAAAGLYAQALAAFVQWVAGQYDAVQDRVKKDRDSLRNRLAAEHARTSTIVAQLAAGYGIFLDFALESGAITQEEREERWKEAWQVLTEATAAQAVHQAAGDPARRFIELLSAAFISGKAHLTTGDGGRPVSAESWGWKWTPMSDSTRDWCPGGDRIGWIDGEDVYLQPDASFLVAQKLSRDQGEVLTVTKRTLHKRMHERGLLASTEAASRETLTVRRTVEGHRRDVLHLRKYVLLEGLSSYKKPDQPGQEPTGAADPAKNPAKGTEKPDHWSGSQKPRPATRPQKVQRGRTLVTDRSGWSGKTK